jgi:hypothetical protein
MLKAGIVEQKRAAVAMQWRSKHVSTATNQHASTRELLEAVFSVVRAAPIGTQRCSKHITEQ